MGEDLRDALDHALCDELDAALGRLRIALTQLTEDANLVAANS